MLQATLAHRFVAKQIPSDLVMKPMGPSSHPITGTEASLSCSRKQFFAMLMDPSKEGERKIVSIASQYFIVEGNLVKYYC